MGAICLGARERKHANPSLAGSSRHAWQMPDIPSYTCGYNRNSSNEIAAFSLLLRRSFKILDERLGIELESSLFSFLFEKETRSTSSFCHVL